MTTSRPCTSNKCEVVRFEVWGPSPFSRIRFVPSFVRFDTRFVFILTERSKLERSGPTVEFRTTSRPAEKTSPGKDYFQDRHPIGEPRKIREGPVDFPITNLRRKLKEG